MRVLTPDVATPPSGGTALTIGSYDGIHRGHHLVLEELHRRAKAAGLEVAVVTFDRHPATVVRPNQAPRLLIDLDEKLELLAAAGVDTTCVVPFDATRAEEEPEVFVEEVLVGALGAKVIVVGDNFRFGRNRRGDVELLSALGGRFGYRVEGVALQRDHGEPISSTRIRRLVAAGAVAEAADLLGRPFSLRGEVVHGAGRGGRELGYPTANLVPDPARCCPAFGVYAGVARTESGDEHLAAISVGVRPTFEEGGAVLVEAYLLDVDADLYGQQLRLDFRHHLREELRFAEVDDLLVQMARDVEQTRALLGG